jgi:hypothetical protein
VPQKHLVLALKSPEAAPMAQSLQTGGTLKFFEIFS